MKDPFQIIKDGGVCTPLGFTASGIASGIKAKNKRDLALIVSDVPATAAGVFTTNLVKAAPVKVSQRHLRSGKIRAIIANSGNANCCTGVPGIDDAKEMTGLTGLMLGSKGTSVLVCSTGRIGVPLPMQTIRKGIRQAVSKLSRDGGLDAARAIMTSDSVHKQVAVKLKINNKIVRIGGCAKGAGMIDPLMATMLSFITTDAALDRATLTRCLQVAIERSFNTITVDGDMSTNDTVLLLANGASGTQELRSYSPELDAFQAGLNYVARQLAKKIVLDGEGVSKFVEVAVKGARTQHDARIVAEAIGNSTLVKSSWYGNDPNWGRIMAAIGYSGARIREELIDIFYEGLQSVKGGRPSNSPIAKIKKLVSKPSFRITVNLHLGESEHTLYTTDLTEAYVRFNMGE